MEQTDTYPITRKQFLRLAAAGLVGVGLAGKTGKVLADSRKSPAAVSPEYRVLGRTGMKVTAVGYGATRTMEASLIKRGLATGINFIDTGRRYARGQHEVMIGKAIKGVRQNVIVQSKMPVRPKERGEALHTAKMKQQLSTWMSDMLDQSLKALQTDYIDIMLLHGVDSTDIINHETIMAFLAQAKKQGRIRACGFSSHANHVALVKEANKSSFYDVIMVPYNHKGAYTHSRAGYYSEWDQVALEAELAEAEKHGAGIVAMKTCSGGPHSPDGVSKPTYKDALKWILSHSFISTMAVAMANVKQIKEDVQAMV